MKRTKTILGAIVAASLVACGPVGEGADSPVTRDDVVNIDDLLTSDSNASGAIQVGDPAEYLAAARYQVDETNGHLQGALEVVRAVVGEREPTRAWVGRDGRAAAFWDLPVDGKDVRFLVVRINARRVRYLLVAHEPGAAWKILLTGIFIKRAPRIGGGRLHVSLTNASDLFGTPGHDGSVHMVFANHRADARGRRIFYLNVQDRGDPNAPVVNYGQDIIHFPGVGGRFRGVVVSDLIPGTTGPAAGTEALAMRVLWRHGEGGRADAALAHVVPAPALLLGHAHECWDTDGLRTAYADTWADNDVENPNAGDPSAASDCGGFGQDDAPEAAASENGHDTDPELDALLEEAEADSISETEADEEEDPAAGDDA